MKTAIYIEQGITQLVLTPETPWEKSVMDAIDEGTQELFIKRGSFYQCQGGWVRESGGQNSIIFRMQLKAVKDNGLGTV